MSRQCEIEECESRASHFRDDGLRVCAGHVHEVITEPVKVIPDVGEDAPYTKEEDWTEEVVIEVEEKAVKPADVVRKSSRKGRQGSPLGENPVDED